MKQQLCFCSLAILAVVALVQSAPPPDKQRLSFKVSARGLKDHDLVSTNPYVKISYTENGGAEETKIGKSGTVSGTSPDWPEIFTFDFDRSKKQKWHFEVKSRDLIIKESEGDAYVNVADYVDKSEYIEVNLSKQGYLIIQKA